jgi:uncharacterized repeat protein (TIGR03803 family)
MKTRASLSQVLFALVFGLGSYTVTGARAQTFAALHNFSVTDGQSPGGLILSGNTLYGGTAGGGAYDNGTVFAMNTDGTGFTNLHSFTASDGSGAGGLVLSGNTLYGTSAGGKWGSGTVFAINTNGTGFVILHSFSTADPNMAPTPMESILADWFCPTILYTERH